MSKPDRYDIALSFAGEQRSYVERVWRRLKANRLKVFYDEDEDVKATHSGERLLELTKHVYSESEFVVMFVSQEYVAKIWPSYECTAIANRMQKLFYRNTGVLIGRFDHSELPDVPADIWYEDIPRLYPQPERFSRFLIKTISSRRRIDQDKIMRMFTYNDFDNIIALMNSYLRRNLSVSDNLFAYYSIACASARQKKTDDALENITICIKSMRNHRAGDLSKLTHAINQDDDLLDLRIEKANELSSVLGIDVDSINLKRTNKNYFATFMPRGGGGCVDPYAAIMTPLGDVLLKDVKVGSEILALSDKQGGRLCPAVVMGKMNSVSSSRLKFNHKLIVSSGQHLFERSLGWVEAVDLILGMAVLKFDGGYERIEFIEESGPGDVVIVSVKENPHTFIANGFVCHNMKF